MSSADSTDTALDRAGNGMPRKYLWRVSGEILSTPITMRFRANNKDEAIRQAHARGMSVDTCEMISERNLGAF